MQVSHTVAAWYERRRAIAGRSVGFVPTMGALHRGHASLVERCRRENEIVVASIFVNPTQFNDPQDLERYPRTLDADLSLLERLGTDEVLAPSVADLYPLSRDRQGAVPCGFYVEEDHLTHLMEGTHRPGFFRGVMTVVLKLLNLVRADRAYFGEKDYQQLRVITEMAKDFFVGTEIVPCPTVREPSGLAESSRNALLSPEDRGHAASLFHVLTSAATCSEARRQLEAKGFTVDYVEEHWGRRLVAAHLAGVRLIDNVAISVPPR